MAAQTPSEDNKINIQKTSLLRARAISYPDLSDGNGRRDSPWLLTGQTCRDMKLYSTSSSLDCENRHWALVANEQYGGIATATRQRRP
jgi:hypothetical protein